MRLLKVFGALVAASHALAFTVPIKDSDTFHEVCSGMYGGKDAYIEVSFEPGAEGQVALVIYEWADADWLGAVTPGQEEEIGWVQKTYICTTSAVRQGLCKTNQLGAFITTLPEGTTNSSIYTTPLRFVSGGSNTGGQDSGNKAEGDKEQVGDEEDKKKRAPHDGDDDDDDDEDEDEQSSMLKTTDPMSQDAPPDDVGDTVVKPNTGTAALAAAADESADIPVSDTDTPATENEDDVMVYKDPIKYDVPKLGYYCVGVVPVTLRSGARRDVQELDARQSATATHATFTGKVLFRNQFKGELSAAEYPKIGLYGVLSIVYCLLAAGWAFLCVRHYQELLPMQYYISGTIVFLIIEMLALFAYYRYINKHGGGAGATAFLVVISILNAARNSLSFFLLLIVAMGLSVVTPSLGPIMNRVRILTALHFVFGVAYAVGTVKVDIDSASLIVVMGLIIPLAVTLTAFLMWIIISLNGTILHLQERKQHFKLAMFQRLWRILIIAVIAVGAFFILSSISLSNRLDEDYAPRNWRWRWLLLDASLAFIYLLTFAAIAWLWRPTDNNVRFAMSQELAQDEADAEDYEIDSLEPRNAHLQADPLGLEPDEGRIRIHGDDGEYDNPTHLGRDSLDDDDEHADERKGFLSKGSAPGVRSPQPQRGGGGPRGVNDDNVVFTMGDDSDDDHASPSRTPLDRSRRSSGSKSKSD